ncbi:MAG: hypothetical protein HFH56_00500 [Lachnospiraceae bacterium]|nr:hypothetical protein [Lachnospiraceae bacterium]MCI9388489.1 hypothetical protein [Lachnospiraceae bacterium]MCI9469688.1 hypothetical protein [Lachnospiraceae bacterium]
MGVPKARSSWLSFMVVSPSGDMSVYYESPGKRLRARNSWLSRTAF